MIDDEWFEMYEASMSEPSTSEVEPVNSSDRKRELL
jgi:hypothetical protein